MVVGREKDSLSIVSSVIYLFVTLGMTSYGEKSCVAMDPSSFGGSIRGATIWGAALVDGVSLPGAAAVFGTSLLDGATPVDELLTGTAALMDGTSLLGAAVVSGTSLLGSVTTGDGLSGTAVLLDGASLLGGTIMLSLRVILTKLILKILSLCC